MNLVRLLQISLIFLAAFLPAWKASAHEVAPAIFTLELKDDREFTLIIKTNVEALLAKIGSQHEDTDEAPTALQYNALRQLPPSNLDSKFRDFAANYLPSIGLAFEGNAANQSIKHLQIPAIGDTALARESTITLIGTIPANAGTLTWAYPEEYGASVLRIERKDQELQAQFFAAGAMSDPIALGLAIQPAWWIKAIDYGTIGFTHILPKGLDHILFVLGLFFLSTNWRPLLAQVTAFTLAHSVTLALGLYGLVSISPSIVEPLIALSIIYVAVENIFTRKLHLWRPVIVFAFGLLHGLGFADILTGIGLPRSDFVLGLIAFNVGVELGQLAVIALAAVAVGCLILIVRTINQVRAKAGQFPLRPGYSAVATPASCAIAAMGAWWFVERTILAG